MDSLTRDDMKTPAKKAAASKMIKLYEIRRWTSDTGCSKRIGAKLLPRAKALAVVRFLKARKVPAFSAALKVRVAA
jgi:hypothetical protein